MLHRREFLRLLAATTGSMLIAPRVLGEAAAAPSDKLGQTLPLRKLGNTGASVTMMGMGGWHLGAFSQEDAPRVVDAALEGGIRFFDTAESYQDGGSESRMGELLVPKYRDHVFIMSKSTGVDAATAQAHLEGTLRRLKTDHLDLWQIHSLTTPQDTDKRLDNGVLDVVLKAREQGKTKYIGFTGHRSPEAHQRMLERTDVLQTCQMPINVLDPSFNSFITGVLPTLVERKMGVLAMKTLSNGAFFKSQPARGGEPATTPVIPNRITVEQALHFVWSLPVSVLISGPDTIDQLKENIAIARRFSDMTEADRLALIEKTADLAGVRVEYYKA
jgi:aryl-alcohol dehydrogenase-like predicted oxidoreductase